MLQLNAMHIPSIAEANLTFIETRLLEYRVLLFALKPPEVNDFDISSFRLPHLQKGGSRAAQKI